MRRGTSINPLPVSTISNEDIWKEHKDEDESARIIPDIEDTVDAKGRQLNQQTAYDKLINTYVQLQHGNEMRYVKVKKKSLIPDVQTTGSYDENPMLNSIIYEIKFEDGHVKKYSKKSIADNILTQVDSDGFTLTMMEGIMDYRKDALMNVT